jgi:uncharacterized protein
MFIRSGQNGKNEWWRYLVSLLVIFLATELIGAIPLFIVVFTPMLSGGSTAIPANLLDFAAMGINPNLGFAIVMFPFVIGILFLLLCVKYIHRKRVMSIVTTRHKFDWRRFGFSSGLWFIFLAASLIFHCFSEPGNYVFQPRWDLFIPLIMLVIILIPLQAGFEELLFRGYLMQGLGLLFKLPWLALLITGLAFGLLHSFNPEVETYGFWLTMPEYVGLGLLFGLLVLLDGGLELPLGIHIMNNVFLSLFITHPSSSLQTPALFEAGQLNPVNDMVELYIFMALFLLVSQWKYGWTGWRSLFQPVRFREGDIL